MVRTPWSQLVSSSVRSFLKRFSLGPRRIVGARKIRQANALIQFQTLKSGANSIIEYVSWAVNGDGHSSRARGSRGISGGCEILEVRQLLTPIANNDSNSIGHNQTLTSDSSHNVLNNDSSGGGMPMPLSASLNSTVSHGSLTLNSSGSYTYTPTTNYVGTDSFTYLAYDGSSYSSPATVTLTVTNNPPVGVSNSYTIYKDSMTFSSSSGVLSNDSDSDGDTLTATLVTNVAHGTLTLNSNGSFTYVPTANYFGTDSFVYVASDGNATSSNTTVTLNGVWAAAPNDAWAVGAGGAIFHWNGTVTGSVSSVTIVGLLIWTRGNCRTRPVPDRPPARKPCVSVRIA